MHYRYGSAHGERDLERVTRQDGREWTYTYDYRVLWQHDFEAGSTVLLSHFTNPEGLSVNYTHTMRLSCEFYDTDRNYASHSCTNGEQVPVLESRTVSGPSLPGGMHYGFSYGKSGNRAVTTISMTDPDYVTPPGQYTPLYPRHRLEFGRLNFFDRPDTMPPEAGKPVRHVVYQVDGSSIARETTWTWSKLYDVIDMSWHNTNWNNWPVFPLSGTSTMLRGTTPRNLYFQAGRRVATETSITQEASQFQRTKSDHDNYGYPQTLVETATLANGGGTHTRTATRTYHNDASEWLIGLLEDETIEGEGTIDRGYYANGKLRYEDRFGTRTDYAYHANGELAEKSWLKGGVTQTYQYLDYYRGIPRQEIDALGHPMSRTVADYGKVLTETDFNGATTGYQYDNLYRLSFIDSPEPGYADTTIAWSPDGLTQTTTRGDYRKIVTYDGLMRPILTQERDNTRPTEEVFTRTQYNALGQVRFQSLPSNDSAETAGYTYTYDTLNRVLTKTFTEDNRTVSNCYGPNCNTIAPYDRLGGVTFGVISADERGYLATQNFRAYGSPSQSSVVTILQETETNPSHHITTTIDRNLLGQITQVDQGGYTRRYIYNGRKLLERVEQPEIGDTVYGYDEAGNRTSRAVGTEPAAIYGYDANNRLTSIDYPNGTPDVGYAYDFNGNTETANVGGGDWTYTYNAENQLDSESLSVDGRTFALGYHYDPLGHLDQIIYPTGRTVAPVPDALGRVRSIGGYVTDADYFPNGQVQSITYDNGQVFNATQNVRRLPEALHTERGGTTLVDLTYTYDDSGNILQIADPILGNKDMEYDGASRLVTAVGPWGNGDIRYDDVGNIVSKSIGTKSLTYHYNATTNLLESVNGSETYTFGYDAYGNVTNNARHAFTYDHASNLVQSGSNTYQYDAHNRRIKVTRQGVDQYYVYSNAGKLMHRFAPSSTKTTDYVYLAGQLIARHDEGPDLDTTPPVVVAPAGVTVEAIALQTPVTLGAASATDNVDGALTPTADNTGPFPLGITSVTWSATDSAGNVGTATQTVTVQDTTAPVLTVPADVTVTAAAPVTVAIGSASAMDIFNVTISNDAPATYPTGTTTVTWTATDANGNSSTGIQSVTVNAPDTTAPVVTAPIGITTEATAVLTPVTLGTATAIDDVDGALTPSADNPGPFPVGITSVTWSATDSAGNVGTATQAVTLQDTTAPVLTVPADVTVTATAPATVAIGSASATDIFGVTISNDAPATYPTGTTTVTWTATDANGNSSTGTQSVTVNVPPPGNTIPGTSGDDALEGSAGDDTINGESGNDWLYGYAGNDTLNGGDGNDWLDGGTGADTLIGGAGDDVYLVDDVGDQVIEQPGEGTDEVRSTISYTLPEAVEALNLLEGAIDGTGNALDNGLEGTAQANVLSGLAGNDWLYGGGGDDTLDGGDGNDWLDGGSGSDTLIGGTGDDVYLVDDAGDQVIEQPGEGTDEVRSTVSYTLPEAVELLNLGDGAIDGTGNALDNGLEGTAQANVLSGLAGNDWLYGEGGNDTLDGGSGDDWLDGGTGNDTYRIAAGDGQDNLNEASEAGSDDQLQYLGAITRQTLWFQASGSDLVIYRLGSSDQVTLRNWFVDPNTWVERITASGDTLLSDDVQTLVDAMAAYGPPVNGAVTLTPEQQQAVNAAIDAAWQ